jgi:hypothetical protein
VVDLAVRLPMRRSPVAAVAIALLKQE